MSKFKKTLFLFLVFILMLNIVLPSSLTRAEGESEDPAVTTQQSVTDDVYGKDKMSLLSATGTEITDKFSITKVELYDKKPLVDADGDIIPGGNKLDDAGYRANANKEVAIILDWELAYDHSYDLGSFYTFSLPKEFKVPTKLSGTLTGGVGNYVVDTDKTVTLTFNEKIENGQGFNGQFFVWISFDQSEFAEGLEQKIDFNSVGQGEIKVNFENNATDGLVKTGEANKNKFNSDEIKWTVDFNQGEKTIKNAVLTDSPDADLTVKGDIEIRQLIIQVDGTLKEGPVSRTETTFPISFGDIDKAYRVTYTTSVNAPIAEPFKDRPINNKVTLTGDSGYKEEKTGTVKISFNEPLNKKAIGSQIVGSKQRVTWKIEYNFNQQTIAKSDAWIEDTLDASNKTKHKLVDRKVNVYEMLIDSSGKATRATNIPINESEYALTGLGTDFDGGFKLEFDHGVTKAYEIEYTTEAQDRIYEDQDVSNHVKISSMTKPASQPLKEVIFAKTIKNEDFSGKKIEWQLVLNKDKVEMTDIVISDEYKDRYMNLDPTSIKVDGVKLEDSKFELVGSADYSEGFVIKLKAGEKINDEVTITYVTTFDPKAGKPKDNLYKNVATLNWNDFNGPHVLKKEAFVQPEDKTNNNGNKIGVYSAKDKEITWTIIVNYNLFDIEDAIIKDSLEGNQAYVNGSLEVNKLKLDLDNNNVTLGDLVEADDYELKVNNDSKSFELKLGKIGPTAYQIKYRTSLEGNFPIEDTYSNHATMQDGIKPFLFEQKATVTPKHGGELLYKTGTQDGQSDTASWTVTINPSQSFVAAGSVVTDTLGAGHLLLADSLMLYKADLPSNNSGDIKRSNTLVDESEYELVVEGNKFTLTFKKDLKTAYILEYKSFITAESGDRIENEVQFAGKSVSVQGDGGQDGIKVALAGAGGGASTGLGQLKISKVDDEDRPLQGVIFELYNAAGTILLETLTTDVKGEATTVRSYKYNDKTNGFPYKLKEKSAPSGYVIDPAYGTGKGKDILFKDPAIPLKITNKIIRQGFEFTKVDAVDSNKKLAGATFVLTRDGQPNLPIGVLISDENGRIAQGDLAPGDYNLVEITAPEFYVVDPTPIPIKIVANQTTIVQRDISNVWGTDGKLIVTKVNAKDQSVIEGIEFELHDSSNTVVDKGTTDVNGVIEFKNLRYGNYSLVEIKADGFVIEQAITLVPIKQSTTLKTIENKENDRSVKLTKWNSNKSQRVQGAVFELREQSIIFDQNGNYLFDVVAGIDESQLTTDQNGELFLGNLAPNKYQLIEIKAPAGYLLDPTPVAFEITDKQTESILVEKTNNRIPTTGGGGGGGGGGITPTPSPTPTPTPGPTPTPTPDPTEPVDPNPGTPVSPEPEKPAKPKEKVTTPKQTPVKGKIGVPKDKTPKVSEKPKHGKVTVDPEGKWVYTPDKDYVGEDSFKIKVTDKDGNEEVYAVGVDVLPKDGTAGNTTSSTGTGKTLPKTGESSQLPLQLAGLSLVILGTALLILRKKRLLHK